ncbi:MAG: D-2-hydroxyacid dehydrogenase [Polyangiaceae bacterium]|nr:D-2-hydroxyacid dehydrogenase [Polyangiaceae bacterium]
MTRRAELIHIHIRSDEQARAELTTLLAPAGRKLEFVDEANIAAVLPDVEVLLCGYAPRIDWSAAVRLRLLHFMGAGVDYLWPAKGLDPRVVIANARSIHAMEMRDHTLAMMLAFERELPRAIEEQAARRWEPFVAGSVAGKTLVIMGLGEVGLPIAKASQALGMRVIGMRNRHLPTSNVDELVHADDLRKVLPLADYLVIAAPLTSRTRGMLGATELSLLPPHAVVVVISRGGIVDEMALVDALHNGRIRGAALDVFETEPLPASSPLWTTPNLVITPHMSGFVPRYLERVVSLFLTNLERFERGEEILTPVDREREY